MLETKPPFSTADFRQWESVSEGSVASDGVADKGGTEHTAADLHGQADPPDVAPEPVSFRATVLISFGSGDRTVSFRHTALSDRHTLFFYSGMVPLDPVLLRIEPLGGCGV